MKDLLQNRASNCFIKSVVAEQPYSPRMEIQTQHTINEALAKVNIKTKVHVSGIGPGVNVEKLAEMAKNKKWAERTIAEINSSQGALLNEKYKVFYCNFREPRNLRDPRSFMFSTRKNHYSTKCLLQQKTTKSPTKEIEFVEQQLDQGRPSSNF